MADSIVERLRRWDDGGISTHHNDCIDTHWRCAILFAADAIEERDAEIMRLRASADHLAQALRVVLHDRPSAHTDNVWAVINHALITYEEARRG